MTTPQAAAASFPASLVQVDPREQVLERFGLLYGYFGALAAIGAILAYLPGNRGWWGDTNLMGGVVLLTLGGPAAIWWELERHKRRTVLVARGGMIGIYQLGNFVRAIGTSELLEREPPTFIKVQYLFGLFLFTLFCVFFLSMPLWLADPSRWLGLVVGVLMVVPCVVGLQSFVKLWHFVIKGYKGGGVLLISKADMSRLRKAAV